MFINGTLVNTPYDTYPEYAPDWRNLIAKAWSAGKKDIVVPDSIRTDKWIAGQKLYYDHTGPNAITNKAIWKNRIVHGWHESGTVNNMKLSLEPLLLTEVPFNIIAADLLGDHYGPDGTEMIQLYERLFYDCRTDDGDIDSCSTRRKWLAFPADMELGPQTPWAIKFKIAAYKDGYTGFVFASSMSGSHGPRVTPENQMDMINKSTSSILYNRSNVHALGNTDLIFAQKNLIDFYKAQAENKGMDAGKRKIFSTLLYTVKLLMPQVSAETVPIECHEMMDKELQNKLSSAHQQVGGTQLAQITGVTDAGSQEALGRLAGQMMSEFDQAAKRIKDGQGVPEK